MTTLAVYSVSDASAAKIGRWAIACGADTVFLSWRQCRELIAQDWDDLADIDSTAGRLDDCRLAGLELTPLDARTADGADVQSDDLYMQMQIAVRFELSRVTLQAGNRDAASREAFELGITRLAALAERMGLSIALRNRLGSGIEQIEDVVGLLSRVPSHVLCVDLDPLELHQAHANPVDAIHAFGSRVAIVRAYDRDGEGRARIGDGAIQWTPFLEALRAADCPLTILIPMDGRKETVAIAKDDVAWIRSALET